MDKSSEKDTFLAYFSWYRVLGPDARQTQGLSISRWYLLSMCYKIASDSNERGDSYESQPRE